MAVKILCDRCGTEVAGYFSVNAYSHSARSSRDNPSPRPRLRGNKTEFEICPMCYELMFGWVENTVDGGENEVQECSEDTFTVGEPERTR